MGPRLACLIFTLLLVGQLCAENTSELTNFMAKIRQLHQTKNFTEAELLLEQRVRDFPDHQKTSLYYGYNLYSQGDYTEAEEELERTISLARNSWDGQQAVFLLAKVQYLSGKSADALLTIEKMKADHPDSGWLPQAWIVEAEIQKGNKQGAEAKLSQQNEGEKNYKIIIDAKKEKGTTETISALKKLAAENKGLPIELSAREAIGHLLSLTSDTQAAIEVFQTLVNDLEEQAPKSRIVQTAHNRLAALYHRLGAREEALRYYNQSIQPSDNAKNHLTESGILKSAGVAFEILQHDVMARKLVTREQWDEVRRMLSSAKDDVSSLHIEIIAALMELESYQWSKEYSKALEAGGRFVDNYSTMTEQYRKEIATAYVCLARITKELRYYEESIYYAGQVVTLYPDQKYIWKGMDHIPRAYYDLIESLYSTRQMDDGNFKLLEFKKRFPDSSYIRVIELNIKSGNYTRRVSKSRGIN